MRNPNCPDTHNAEPGVRRKSVAALTVGLVMTLLVPAAGYRSGFELGQLFRADHVSRLVGNFSMEGDTVTQRKHFIKVAVELDCAVKEGIRPDPGSPIEVPKIGG